MPLDDNAPLGLHRWFWQRRPASSDSDSFGRMTEVLARAMGTPWFLLILTVFCAIWIAWNVWAPVAWRFDSAANGFTALTLMLSLQASYSSPLILLAQNRQADRDRVQDAQDRQTAARNMMDTEYLAREVAALKLLMADLPTETALRSQIEQLGARLDALTAAIGVDVPAGPEGSDRGPEPPTGV